MKFARPIYLLLSVQTVLLVVLYIKVNGLESSLEVASDHSQSDPLALVQEPESDATPQTTSATDAEMLRRIVREELRAITPLMANQSEPPSESNETRVYDQVELEYRRSLILDEMELMKQEEEVSTADLNQLMGEIALLDPERRSEMLAELNAALNRGEIRGRL